MGRKALAFNSAAGEDSVSARAATIPVKVETIPSDGLKWAQFPRRAREDLHSVESAVPLYKLLKLVAEPTRRDKRNDFAGTNVREVEIRLAEKIPRDPAASNGRRGRIMWGWTWSSHASRLFDQPS